MQTRRIFGLLCAGIALASYGIAVFAQTFIITHATLIDGTGAAPVADVSIVVDGKYIKRLSGDVVEADGATVIDAGGLIVMPGLIDMHTHPTFEVLTKQPKLPFPDPAAMPSSDADMREFIASRLPKRLQKFLHSGITTVISAGSYWPYEIDIRERIASGELAGPQLLVASPIFTAPGGHPASGICSGEAWCVERLSVEVDDAAAARAGVRRFAAGGVQAIKFVYDSFNKTHLGGPNLDFPRLDREVMAAIIDESKLAGLPVIAHTKTVDETAIVVRAGVDALVHSALMENPGFTTRDGEYLPRLVHAHGLSITTTIRSFHERLVAAPAAARERMQANFDLVGPSLRAYSEAGVTLMFGTDFDGAGLDPDPGEAVRSEARALVAAGFSELEVITMATGNAKRHPVVPDALGTIEPGSLADLLILAEDPLEDISAITRPLLVMKAGRVLVDKR